MVAVPSLKMPGGSRSCTQTGAVASRRGEAEAQCLSWMSFTAATLHPARRRGLEHARIGYALADTRTGDREWALGRYSIAEIHLFRMPSRFRNPLSVLLGSEVRPLVGSAPERTSDSRRTLGNIHGDPSTIRACTVASAPPEARPTTVVRKVGESTPRARLPRASS